MAAMTAVAAIGLGAQPAIAEASAQSSCGASNYWAYLQGSTFKLYLCGVGTTNLSGPDLYTELVISNHSNRIWLHQNPDNSGWADCFQGANKQIALSGRNLNPGNVQISSNTSFCA